MKTVAIIIFDHCMASSITGPMDLFNICNSVHRYYSATDTFNLFNVELVSVTDQDVISSSGLTFSPTLALSSLHRADIILIGGYHDDKDLSLKHHHTQLSQFIPVLKEAFTSDTLICTFCTGSFFLAQAGLLDGMKCTTSWWLSDIFKQRFPQVDLIMDQLVVKNDNIWTTGATTAYTTLCMELIERYTNHQITAQLSRIMLVDQNRSSQLPYMSVQHTLRHKDKEIADCQHWLTRHLNRPLSVEDMANYCGLSIRTFIRRFKSAVKVTPASYLQRLRIDKAKQLLENTNQSLEQITTQIGYDDISAFRRAFTKQVSLSPQAYRRSFSTAQYS
ncbi:hypothetical protein CW748_10615 [Alteromonadales bacterium alter-6D02]|nr:hypothetical protein CW748_10615 [Alteromonadales bacterium alter-6D02]